MNIKLLLAIASVVSVLYAIALLLFPRALDVQFGMSPDAETIYIDRFLGGALLALAVISWTVREAADRNAVRGVLLGLSAGSAVAIVVAIWGVVAGITNAMGWSTVVVFALLLAGYLYYLFRDPALSGRE
jgi:hypothetical protein